MLTYADVGLTYADVCRRMPTEGLGLYRGQWEKEAEVVSGAEYLVKDARLVSIEVHHPNRPAARGAGRQRLLCRYLNHYFVDT